MAMNVSLCTGQQTPPGVARPFSPPALSDPSSRVSRRQKSKGNMRECREFGDLDAVPAINALDNAIGGLKHSSDMARRFPPIHRTADEKITHTAAN